MSDTTGPLTRQFTAEQIEIALSTLADLYENSDDNTGDYLSEKQQEVAELVRHAKADIDNPDVRGPLCGDRAYRNHLS